MLTLARIIEENLKKSHKNEAFTTLLPECKLECNAVGKVELIYQLNPKIQEG